MYPTLTEQYAWYVSVAYLKGRTPALVIAILCIVFIVPIIYAHSVTYGTIKVSDVGVTDHASQWRLKWLRVALLSGVLFVNCVGMIALNSGYVYITLTYGSDVNIVAQLCVAMIKLFWNEVAVCRMVLIARGYYSPEEETEGSKSLKTLIAAQQQRDETADMPFLTFTILFNSILAPCLANMAVNPSCFKDAVIAVPNVVTSVQYIKCDSFELELPSIECLNYAVDEINTSYAPPFMYNYQCSSSVIASYASVYVYMFLFVAFIKPVFVIILARRYATLSPSSKLYRLMDEVIYTLLRPNQVSPNKVILNKERLVLRIIGKLAVFLTFGVMFPPLAVVSCIALLVDTYMVQLMIG
jgi:hypothetical protein